MKTEELLSELTHGPVSADALVVAACALARRRRLARNACTAAVVLSILLAGIALLPKKPAEQTVAQEHLAPPKPHLQLTADELLDSFGKQPVALVTYKDGRQMLLAFEERAPLNLKHR